MILADRFLETGVPFFYDIGGILFLLFVGASPFFLLLGITGLLVWMFRKLGCLLKAHCEHLCHPNCFINHSPGGDLSVSKFHLRRKL